MTKTGIIGHTGFVGSNLDRQFNFDDHYNSKNIGQLAGHTYDLLVISGARAEKWKINQNPEEDEENIKVLTDALKQVEAKKVILISTVDIYPDPRNVDEDTNVSVQEHIQAYGKHRLELELFVRANFIEHLVVRLPGLYGQGLKKNAIYDFLHNNNLNQIHTDSIFQFYGLDHLWTDISTAVEGNLRIVNLATEPVSIKEVAKEAFGIEFTNRPEDKTPVVYDMHTKHAQLFGGPPYYIQDKEQVLDGIRCFVDKER
jgi:nucleoside-diphosphate-sugar epimerase